MTYYTVQMYLLHSNQANFREELSHCPSEVVLRLEETRASHCATTARLASSVAALTPAIQTCVESDSGGGRERRSGCML